MAESWYVLYKISNGEAHSIGVDIADPLPAGYAKKLIGIKPPGPDVIWDTTQLKMVPVIRTSSDLEEAVLIAKDPGTYTAVDRGKFMRLILKRLKGGR